MQGRTCVSARPKRAHTQVRPYFSLMLIPAGPAVSCVPDCSDARVITTPLSLIMVSSPVPPAMAKVVWLAI